MIPKVTTETNAVVFGCPSCLYSARGEDKTPLAPSAALAAVMSHIQREHTRPGPIELDADERVFLRQVLYRMSGQLDVHELQVMRNSSSPNPQYANG